MTAGSLRGIQPGAVVTQVYFEINDDRVRIVLGTFDEAMDRAKKLCEEHALRQEILREVDVVAFSVEVRMRWVIRNADGVTVDAIIDRLHVFGEGAVE